MQVHERLTLSSQFPFTQLLVIETLIRKRVHTQLLQRTLYISMQFGDMEFNILPGTLTTTHHIKLLSIKLT